MRLPLITWVLLLSLPGRAQQPFVQQYPADVYKGATQNWEMTQDDQGVLYFANNDGVLTYDGKEWNLIAMPNKEFVFSIALHSDGRIFVASYNELGFFTRDNKGNHSYNSLLPKLPPERRNFKYMNEIAIQHDTVFFADREHVYIYSNDEFTVLNEANGKFFKYRDELYLVRKDGLYRYNNSGYVPSEINQALRGTTIRWVDEYADTRILILDEKNDLWEYNPEPGSAPQFRFVSSALKTYLKGITRFRMLALDNGNLAVLSANEVAIFDPSMNKKYTITKEAIDENLTMRILYGDSQHNLWLTTNASILQLITSSPLGYYDKHNGLNGVILALGKSGTHAYAGTNTGIFHMEAGMFTVLPETTGETWNFYNFHDRLYAAHGTGVFEVNGSSANRIVEHRHVHSLCSLRNEPNKMLMGTYNSGIWLLEKQPKGWSKSRISGFEEETRFMQEDDDGQIWVSHYNKGLFRLQLNPQRDSVIRNTFYDSKHGLPSDLNNRVCRFKNGDIVVTTTNGFYRFDKSANRFFPLEAMNAALGENFCVYTVHESEDGHIYFWGGSPQTMERAGVLRKNRDGSFACEFTPFNKNTVAIRDLRVDVDAPVLAVKPNEVWVGNNVKVITYNPLQKTFFNEPFKTFIKNVEARDSSILSVTSTLPYSLNSLKVRFVGSFFENPERTEYQYKLDGFQDGWSAWSGSAEAVFTNLPKGNYTFSVRARNLYGTMTEPADFTFYIHPPWYNTWWAYVIYGLFGVSLVGVLVRLNTKRIRRQKMKLERKVRKKTKKLRVKNKEIREKGKEITKQARELETLNLTKDKLFSIVSHDLRGPVKQIQVVLNMIEPGHISEEEFKAFIPKFKESIEHTVNLTDNLLHWANSQLDGIQVKPAEFNIRGLAAEHYQLFKPLADGKNIELINSIDTDLIAYADKDMVKLVLRNLLNNAIKFTDSDGKIILGCGHHKTFVEISVCDTGIGIAPDHLSTLFTRQNLSRQGTFGEKGTGLGLMLCQEFIEKNGGSIHVDSEIGKGSKFWFRIPGENGK